MITRVAIEGIDGSGKTSVALELAKRLKEGGITAKIFAPFRAANEQLGEDIYKLWGDPTTALTAVKTLKRVIDACEVESDADGTDVIIYDRHWMTAFTEIGSQPDLVATWGDQFVPAALLQTAPAVAARWLQNDPYSQWSQLHEQNRYATTFGLLVQRHREHMLGIYRNEPDVSVEALARNIEWDMNIRR